MQMSCSCFGAGAERESEQLERQLETLLIFYARYAPSKTRTEVETLMLQRKRSGASGGSEQWWGQLCDSLAEKYSEHPEALIAGDAVAGGCGE